MGSMDKRDSTGEDDIPQGGGGAESEGSSLGGENELEGGDLTPLALPRRGSRHGSGGGVDRHRHRSAPDRSIEKATPLLGTSSSRPSIHLTVDNDPLDLQVKGQGPNQVRDSYKFIQISDPASPLDGDTKPMLNGHIPSKTAQDLNKAATKPSHQMVLIEKEEKDLHSWKPTKWQIGWTMGLLLVTNLINYMDRVTIAGSYVG